jgi:hypothetical protein
MTDAEQPQSHPSDDSITYVLKVQHAAAQQGLLAMWTVYDHPTDHPDSFIARCHVVGSGIEGATTNTIRTETLRTMRMVLRMAGLTPIKRDPADDAKIVEVWL